MEDGKRVVKGKLTYEHFEYDGEFAKDLPNG